MIGTEFPVTYHQSPITSPSQRRRLWTNFANTQNKDDYFSRQKPFEGAGWSHFEGGETAQENKYEFSWPLGDLITALAGAGLVIERLEEYPSAAEWRFGAKLQEAARLPGEYLLIAHK